PSPGWAAARIAPRRSGADAVGQGLPAYGSRALSQPDGGGATCGLAREVPATLWGRLQPRAFARPGKRGRPREDSRLKPLPRDTGGRGLRGAIGVRGEALAAAAFGRDVGVLEHELFVQALLQEIDAGAVDQRQAVGV